MMAARTTRRAPTGARATSTVGRVGRPRRISDACILEAARAVFLARGIRATTAEVARRADVAEGTLFRRFDSKDALFRAAMRFDPEDFPRLLESLRAPSSTEEMRQVLVEAATHLLEHARVALPVMMMSWSNSSGAFALARLSERADPIRRARRALISFFRAQIAAGRLAERSPEVLARVFLGSVHHYCFSEIVGIDSTRSRMSVANFARALVDLLMCAPCQAGPSPRKRASTAKRARTRT